MFNLEGVVTMMIPIVGTIATFGLLAVMVWAGQRRGERQLHYRHELLKKVVEKEGHSAASAFLRDQSEIAWTKRREGLKLGGLMMLAIGIGFMIGFQWLDDGIWMIGAVPTAIGIGLLAYGLFQPAAGRASR